MARLAGSLAALFVVCRAEAHEEEPRSGLANNNGINYFDAMNPVSVPSTDKCGVNCYKICGGLGRNGFDCKKTCYAHSIETTRAATWYEKERPQGKYMQKVMTEYCDRGVCGRRGGLLQAAAVSKHEHLQQQEDTKSDHQEGDAWGYPATNKGWPVGKCAKQKYYCTQLCQNLYHQPTGDLGEHPGADANWQKNQDKCKKDCNVKENFEALTEYFDEFCACLDKNGRKELPVGLLQEEPESVDVGSFIQLPSSEL
jgi:hypothetical protein